MATRRRFGTGLPLAGGGGARRSNLIHQSEPVTLDNDDIIALPTTGVVIVPDPGDGLFIIPLIGVGVVDTTDGLYGGGVNDASWNLLYENGDYASLPARMDAALKDVQQLTAFTLLPESALGAGTWDGSIVTLNSAPTSQWGGALLLKDDFAGTTNYTGGHANNTVKLTVIYYVYNVATGQFQ